MSRRTFKSHTQELSVPENTSQLPTTEPVAVYYRQSTEAQVGNISTDIQTIDMTAFLRQQGWQKDDIWLIDADEGISGTKKIDERPGMRNLFDLIVERKIRAVACQDEDRLFRDVTQIQVNIFIQACKDAHVLVITPSMVYDFAHEQLGVFHARQFRFKCEMAAEYINSVIKGKLHRAKEHLMREGRWAGASIPPGFMVDLRKELPDGSPNPNWYKYVPFEPFAEVIRHYNRIFLEEGGCLSATLRRIQKERVYYPDPTTCLPLEGFATHYKIRSRGDGYYPGRNGLWMILTNPAYIGHWCFHGEVIRRNNHPAILPDKQFMQAFNYLSPYGLDGQENRHFRPFQQHARPTLESERPVERPLYAGILYGYINGKRRRVGTRYAAERHCYIYVLGEREYVGFKPIWSRRADWIDEAISRHFQEKLLVTFNSEMWQQNLSQFSQAIERERKLKRTQLMALEEAMQNVVTSIESMSNLSLIHAVEIRYTEMQEEQHRLKSELEAMDTEHQHYTEMQSLQGTFETAIAEWPSMSRGEKRSLLLTFINTIEVVDPQHMGSIQIVVYWRDGSKDEFLINKMPTVGCRWRQDDIDRLLELVDSGASQFILGAAFPDKKWKQIRGLINRLRGRTAFSPAYFKQNETFNEFLARGGEPLRNTASTWSDEEVEELGKLIERGATQLQFMEAFPYRRWMYIRVKVTAMFGTDCKIALDEGVLKRETFQEYQERAGRLSTSSVPHSP